MKRQSMDVVASDAHDTLMCNSEIKLGFVKKICGFTVSLRDLGKDVLIQRMMEHGFSADEADACYAEISALTYTRYESLRQASPIEGAYEVTRELRDRGFRVILITASGPKAFSVLRKWLRADGRFDWIECYTCGRHGDKSALSKELGVRYYLDNKLRPLDQLEFDVPERYLLLRPNNASLYPFPTESRIRLARDWVDFGRQVVADREARNARIAMPRALKRVAV